MFVILQAINIKQVETTYACDTYACDICIYAYIFNSCFFTLIEENKSNKAAEEGNYHRKFSENTLERYVSLTNAKVKHYSELYSSVSF